MTRRRSPHLLLLAMLVIVLFYPLLFAPFNSLDDRKLVNFLINHDSLPIAWHFSPGGVERYYRPLITLSYAFDQIAWGLEESFMHLENILVHLLNVFLVFALGRKLVVSLELNDKPMSDWLPLVAAGLFAVHPVTVEAVAWITARTDLLAGTFVLMALYALLAALRHGSLGWGVAAAVCLGLGCLCKETALFFLPGAGMLLLTHDPEGRSLRAVAARRLVVFLMMVAMIGGYFILRSQAFERDQGVSITARMIQSSPPVAVAVPESVSHVRSPLSTLLEHWGPPMVKALSATGYYLRKLIWPWPLNFAITGVNPAWALGGLVVWLAAGWLALRRTLPSALLLTALGLLCSALLVAVSPLAWTLLAERYLYVPLGPFVLGVVFWLGPRCYAQRWRALVISVLAAITLVFAATVVWRCFLWQDNLRLYRDAVEQSPDFAPAINELANALAERGQREQGVTVLESIRRPDNEIAMRGQVSVQVEKGNLDEAMRLLKESLIRSPANAVDIMEQLIEINSRRIENTVDPQIKTAYFRETLAWLVELERLTRNPFHWYRQGRIYLILGDRDNARRCFAEAAFRFPETSLYRAPARKLAENLSQ